MRSSEASSWSQTLSLGVFFVAIWFSWSLVPQTVAEAMVACVIEFPLWASSAPQENKQKTHSQDFEAWVDDQLIVYESIEQKHLFLLEKSPFYSQFQKYIEGSTPGWILYRPSTPGSCIVWIKTLNPVQKGSAVIIGDCVVGFIDVVHGLCARLRLVTDTRSKVAVEIKKASALHKEGIGDVSASMKALSMDVSYWQFLAEHGLFQDSSRALEIQKLLKDLQKELYSDRALESTSLQGLLRGSPNFWRYGQNHLVAEGFYRQIEISETSFKPNSNPIEPGDLLVTSGLDGRYPPGLRVGYVSGVRAQDPANTLFEVEASSALADFSKEKWVWVLPPMMSLEESSATRSL